MSLENFGEPVTLVRSPIMVKLESGRIVSGSKPENWVFGVWRSAFGVGGSAFGVGGSDLSDRTDRKLSDGSWRGATPFTDSAIARICSGVVPQQPPTMFSQPLAAHSFNWGESDSGVSGKPVSESASGRPAFG